VGFASETLLKEKHMNIRNDQLVLICGESATGKSASLMGIRDQEKSLYLNAEAGKKLPMKNKFDSKVITDPYQVFEAFDYTAPGQPGNLLYHTIIIDTLTFLMDMFESQYVLRSANTMAGWGQYQQYYKELMQEKIAISDKNVIVMAHTRADYDEKDLDYKVKVPVKGALQNNGIEAYFSTVVATKKVSLKELADYKSDLLHITPDDELLGYKHVFQTRLTAKTKNERIRSPIGMFSVNETYMDNDAQMLLDHLHQFYN
jgi:hypothetical protein